MDTFAPSPGTVTREYVWGPGYADEIVCQLDYSADPLGGTGVTPVTYYYRQPLTQRSPRGGDGRVAIGERSSHCCVKGQDANSTLDTPRPAKRAGSPAEPRAAPASGVSRVHVVAVVQPAAGGYPAQVLYQYTYGPYGDVLAADAHPTLPLPVNRIGHQGLFFERLTTGSVNAPMLAVGARGLYHSRNRWLHVELGRFLTRDPAEAAIPIITALTFNGDTLDGLAAGTPTLPFSPTGHYADGMNLYQFVGSNPVNRSDPLGLNWNDPFDDVDEVIGGIYAARASAAMDFYRFFKGMALSMLQMTAEGMICAFVPGGVFIVGGYHMAHAGVDMWQEGLSLSNCLEMGLGAAPFAGKLIGGFTKGLARMRASRAAAAGAAATGELHHAISMKVWKALEANPATRGRYQYRDPRFVTCHRAG